MEKKSLTEMLCAVISTGLQICPLLRAFGLTHQTKEKHFDILLIYHHMTVVCYFSFSFRFLFFSE